MEIRATPKKAREWRHALGELAAAALTVRRAHEADTAETNDMLRLVEASVTACDPVNVADLAIDGKDLIALGFTPGRRLQDVLYELLELVWEDPSKNSRDTLIKEALLRKD